MIAAQRIEAAGQVRSRGMTLSNPGMTPIEERVFEYCRAAAASGAPLASIDEIKDAIGAESFSTVPGIMRRLEAKGYITRNIYQRGRQVCIVETGQCSAPPPCTAPHWRVRTEAVQAPAIQAIRERSKPLSAMIEAEARLSGKPMSEFLADLVYIGWHEYAAEKDRGE